MGLASPCPYLVESLRAAALLAEKWEQQRLKEQRLLLFVYFTFPAESVNIGSLYMGAVLGVFPECFKKAGAF